jgi:hypothetical protein
MSNYIIWWICKKYILNDMIDYVYKNYKHIPIDISCILYKKYGHIPKEIINLIIDNVYKKIYEENKIKIEDEFEPIITILDKSKFDD